jgi:hypothetical protein
VLHSKEIEVVDFQVPAVTFSDHRPVLVDFNVDIQEEHRGEERPPHCSCIEKQNQLFADAFGFAS